MQSRPSAVVFIIELILRSVQGVRLDVLVVSVVDAAFVLFFRFLREPCLADHLECCTQASREQESKGKD